MLFLWSYASGDDNIGIKYEKLHFNQDTINSLNRFAKNYRFNVTYFYGYLVKFDKDNVYAISPYKILFSKNDLNLLVLHYDDYMENENFNKATITLNLYDNGIFTYTYSQYVPYGTFWNYYIDGNNIVLTTWFNTTRVQKH